LNTLNIAVVGTLGGYLLFVAARRLLPSNAGGVTLAAALAAGLAVPLAAAALVAEYAVGGTESVSLGSFAVAMLGTHLLVGIGEAVVTGCAVSAVLASRPDLVAGHRAMPGRIIEQVGAAA
jgi:cobalt/nickel transport system permease protein